MPDSEILNLKLVPDSEVPGGNPGFHLAPVQVKLRLPHILIVACGENANALKLFCSYIAFPESLDSLMCHEHYDDQIAIILV